MKCYTLELIALQSDPAQGLHHSGWDGWPPEAVLFRADAKTIRLKAKLPGVDTTLSGYLSSIASIGTYDALGVAAEEFATQVVEKVKEKVGPWVDEWMTQVTAAIVDDDGPVYMPLVLTDMDCRRVAKLWIGFKEEAP